MLQDGDLRPTWVSWVPSSRHDVFLQRLVEAVADHLGVPERACLHRQADGARQQSMHNSAQAAANAWRSLTLLPDVEVAGPVLLLDHVVRTRWTLTVASHLLRERGSGPVHPLVLCDLGGSG